MSKVCPRCKSLKDHSEFSKHVNRKDGLQVYCKSCKSVFRKQHYWNNVDYYKDKAVEFRRKMHSILRKAKDRPCCDCGNIYPYYVMDLDHARGIKIDCVGNMVSAGRIKAIIAEIEKCEVVCSNCHRIRTHNRKHP